MNEIRSTIKWIDQFPYHDRFIRIEHSYDLPYIEIYVGSIENIFNTHYISSIYTYNK